MERGFLKKKEIILAGSFCSWRMDDNLALALPATATPVARQPSVSGRPVANKNASGDRGTFAVLCLFQRLMIQLSRIVISHALNESLALRAVNKKCENTYGRIRA